MLFLRSPKILVRERSHERCYERSPQEQENSKVLFCAAFLAVRSVQIVKGKLCDVIIEKGQNIRSCKSNTQHCFYLPCNVKNRLLHSAQLAAQ